MCGNCRAGAHLLDFCRIDKRSLQKLFVCSCESMKRSMPKLHLSLQRLPLISTPLASKSESSNFFVTFTPKPPAEALHEPWPRCVCSCPTHRCRESAVQTDAAARLICHILKVPLL